MTGPLQGLGLAIRAMRDEQRLSQRALARRASLSPGALSRIESGENNPSADTLSRVLAGLGKDLLGLHYALAGSPAPPSPPPPPVNAEGAADEPIDRFAVRLAVGALRDRGAVKELQEIAMSGKLPDLQRAGETSGRVDKGTAPVRGKAARGNGS